MKALGAALLEAQKDAPGLQRDAINPHFRSNYVSLDSLVAVVLPILNKHGIVVMQTPTISDGRPALRTKLIHAASGESEEDTMLLELEKDTPQGQGSAITYARRYSLMSMLGLVADVDDDGNAATPQNGTPKPAAAEPNFTFDPAQERSEAQAKMLHRLVKVLGEAGKISEPQFVAACRSLKTEGTTTAECIAQISKQNASGLISRLKKLEDNEIPEPAPVPAAAPDPDDDIPF